MAQLPKNERRFVGISYYELDVWTHRPRHEIINIGLHGETKDSVEEMARKEISTMPVPSNIYRETLQKNLFVISESAAKRSYKTAWHNYEDADGGEYGVTCIDCNQPATERTDDGGWYCAEHFPG